MCNSRPFVLVVLGAVVFGMETEGVNAEAILPESAKVLLDKCECDAGELHHMLENHFRAGTIDEGWSRRAAFRLKEWFETEGNIGKIAATCVADMCAVDFLVTFYEFARIHEQRAYEWDQAKHAGYLPVSLFFPRGDGSTRLFVFRDSFDAASLKQRDPR